MPPFGVAVAVPSFAPKHDKSVLDILTVNGVDTSKVVVAEAVKVLSPLVEPFPFAIRPATYIVIISPLLPTGAFHVLVHVIVFPVKLGALLCLT